MPSQPQNVQSGTPQMAPQVTSGHTGQPPQRTVSTPLQLLAGQQNTNQTSPNMMPSQFPSQTGASPSQPATQQRALFMPAETFANAYKTFCQSKGIHLDQALLSHDGRPIDLYQLHVQVLSVGGGPRVSLVCDAW